MNVARPSELPIPSSSVDMEQLVQKLYLPNPPPQIARIQETLQALQRSPDGWKMADVLLGSPDNKVRFFGALTFTVKLNLDWQTLDSKAAEELLHTVLSWLVRFVSRNEEDLVVRKLCGTLVTYFLRFPSSWVQCLRQVIYSLCEGHVVPYALAEESEPRPEILSGFNRAQIMAALWFSSSLVETAARVDKKSIQNVKVHENITLNASTAVTLLESTFAEYDPMTQVHVDMRREGMSCYLAWIFYNQPLKYADTSEDLRRLRRLIDYPIRFLAMDAISENAIKFLTDVLTNFPEFLDSQAIQTLTMVLGGPWSYSCFERLRGGGGGECEEEWLDFANLIMAFCQHVQEDIISTPVRPETQQILAMLHGFLGCDGLAASEREIWEAAVEWWTSAIDHATEQGEDQVQPWMAYAKPHFVQALEECWANVRYPSAQVMAEWDTDDMRSFKQLRNDVAYLTQSSYALLGLDIANVFIDSTLRSLRQSAWEDAEAGMFCLGSLTDCIPEGAIGDTLLARLFASPSFTPALLLQDILPIPVRQTAVSLFGKYSRYFEFHRDSLPGALEFLFCSLATPEVAGQASKSISAVCSASRTALTSQVGPCIHRYEQLLRDGPVEVPVKERVLGAIASIIEAQSRDEDKADSLRHLLAVVQADVLKCLNSQTMADTEAHSLATCALHCLVSIGRNMRAPNEVPIDLDSDVPRSSFWELGDGRIIQAQIVQMIQALIDRFPNEGEIIEISCSVFRTGLSESASGPFVFTPATITSFLMQFVAQTPRVGIVLDTARALISSRSSESSTRIDIEAQALLSFVTNCIHQVDDHNGLSDPEIAQKCIDFLDRLIPHYLSLLLQLQPSSTLEKNLLFTLKCLTGSDPLPKRSAATFWISMVDVCPSPGVFAHEAIRQVVEHLGPSLAEALIFGIGGNAARSEIDLLTEPLKKLVVRQPSAKTWLEAALVSDRFPSIKVGRTDKRIFLQKIISLRGARSTNQVTRDFWLACRGSDFAYAS